MGQYTINNVEVMLESIKDVKSDIATAIINKGVDVPEGTNFGDFPDKISQISGAEPKPEETFEVTPTNSDQTITPTEGSVFSSGVVKGYDVDDIYSKLLEFNVEL